MSETISLNNVYEELKKIEKNMVTKIEMNRFIETCAILSNPDTMNQIMKSEEDITSGRFKEVKSLGDL